MGAWYWIGVLAGIGVALGILVAGDRPAGGGRAVAAAIGGAAIGVRPASAGPRRSAVRVGGVAGGYGAAPVVDRRAQARRHAARRSRGLVGARRDRRRRARVRPGRSATSRRSCMPGARDPSAPPDARALRRPAHARARLSVRPAPKPVVLIIIDGLTPSMLEATDAPGAPLPARPRQLPPRGLDLPVAHARLPRLDRDRRPRRRARDPAPRLVEPRASSGSSSTARRSPRCAPPGSSRACATRSST